MAAIDRLPVSGSLPIDVSHIGSCGVSVTAADRGIAKAGLRPGDTIEYQRMPAAERGAFLLGTIADTDVFSLPVLRDGRLITVNVTATPWSATQRRDATLLIAIAIAWTFFGVIALWFGRDAASQYVGIFLTLITIAAYAAVPVGQSPLGDVAFAVVSAFDVLAFVALYLLTEQLAGPEMPLRTLLRAIVGVAAAVGTLIGLAQEWSVLGAGCRLIYADNVELACDFTGTACALLGMAFAVFGSDPERRQRARWIFWSSVVGLGGVFYALFAAVGHFPDPANGYSAFLLLALPIGYVIATVRDRTFDVEFVANRAIVYAVMIVGLVSIFVALKGAIARYVSGLGGLASTFLDLGVSIGVALSLRTLESRIQKGVERTLFRRKYDALSALEQLGAQASYYERDDVLLASVAAAIRTQFQARWVTVYVRGGTTYVPLAQEGLAPAEPLDADDPALVKLRATGELLDLDAMHSRIAADGVVVPLTVGGRLLGAIACGPRHDFEVYDPDERAALTALGVHVGVALFALADRARERFVGQVASGSLAGHDARVEARRLMKMAFEAEPVNLES